jgi:F-type H+-transporting ATPase subunit delta
MISSAVFGRYARSLADVVLEKNEESAVTAELAAYREIFKAVPNVVTALDSPAVPHESKLRLLGALTEKYPVGGTARNFLRVLIDHHRIRYFEEIFQSYVKTVNERRGILQARVTAAYPLSQDELSALSGSLSGATGKKVTLDVRTDPGLVGGLVVQIGSTVYDGSVRSQLDEMRRRLAEA